MNDQTEDSQALPEMDSLADIPHATTTPEDWDEDYRSTWQKLQVAERNKMQWRAYALRLRATLAAPAADAQAVALRYTSDGALAECPCCGSLDVGGAHDTVHCYACDLTMKATRPLQNAIEKWNRRIGAANAAPATHALGGHLSLCASVAAPQLPTAANGGGLTADSLRGKFESLASDSYGFKRSRKGTYVNSAVARDWKWFKSGIAAAQPTAVMAGGLSEAADFIDKRAQEYLDGNAGTEHNTGAITYHYGEAGRAYYNTLTELADELRKLPPNRPPAIAGGLPVEQSPYEAITLANLKAGKLSAARVYIGYCELSEELKVANGAIKRYQNQVAELRPAAMGPVDRPPFAWINLETIKHEKLTDYAETITLEATSVKFGHHTTPIYLAARQPASGAGDLSAASRDVLAERQRQVSAEGWTLEHDDDNDRGEMADAAIAYVMAATAGPEELEKLASEQPGQLEARWPTSWCLSWFKPKGYRRDLVRAAALLLAEIERIDRRAANGAAAPKDGA